MKKASLTKTEQRFLWTAALVCAVCVALAFGFAVPRQTGPGRAAGSETPLIQLARVDLNTAGQDALCTLPGVGEQRARAIIEYREQYGRFAAVEEAAAVPGLTEAVGWTCLCELKRCGESRRSGKKGVNYYERGYDLHQP